MQARRAKLQPLCVALVKQMFHAHVRYRNVVLRVVRDLPDIAGADRVEDKCVIEIPAHSAWRRLDPPPLCRHLWIVAVPVLRLGNHRWSLLNSRIQSPPMGYSFAASDSGRSENVGSSAGPVEVSRDETNSGCWG